MYYPRIQAKNAINDEKMDGIIDAILQGKYSIACLLLLEATGYNPLQYMPYRTYNRLQKQRQQAIPTENKIASRTNQPKTAIKRSPARNASSVGALSKEIADLDYVEPLPGSKSSHEAGGSSTPRGLFPWVSIARPLTHPFNHPFNHPFKISTAKSQYTSNQRTGNQMLLCGIHPPRLKNVPNWQSLLENI